MKNLINISTKKYDKNVIMISFILNLILLISLLPSSSCEIQNKNVYNLDTSITTNNNNLQKKYILSSSYENENTDLDNDDNDDDDDANDDDDDDDDDNDDGDHDDGNNVDDNDNDVAVLGIENVHKYNIEEEIHPQLFAAYHESYITKEAAKKLRQKIKSHKKPYTEKEYDDLLQEIILQQEYNPKSDIYDKKYFDYLPAEEIIDFDSDVDELDKGTVTTTTTTTESTKHNKRFGGKRVKRDVYFNDEKLSEFQDKIKREAGPATFFIPRETQSVVNPYVYSSSGIYNNNNNNNYNNNNPWRFAGSQKYLYNFYLPPTPSVGYYYPRPQTPFVQVPPGMYFNAPVPPQNPIVRPPLPQPGTMAPPTTDDGTVINDRFAPVWDIVENTQAPSSVGRPIQTSVTRPKAPPLIHNSEGIDNNLAQIPQNRPAVAASRPRPPPLIHNSDADDDDDDANNSANEEDIYVSPSGANQRTQEIFNSPTITNQLDLDNAPIWSSVNNDVNRRPTFRTQQNFPIQSTPQPRPPTPQAFAAPSNTGLSRCVWGIVNCCSRRNAAVRYACFEKLGCQGAFWDVNPCRNDILDAAIGEADQYFD